MTACGRSIQLFKLPQELNDCVYTSEKYPLLVDVTGQATQFLKYRSRFLSILKKGDFEKESLRKGLTQALHGGATLVLDFDKLQLDLDGLFDKEHFPEATLSPQELFLEETYEPLLRKTDDFAGKVTYEHSAADAVGAFQDRTKAHAPERCADVDTRFEPKEGFRLVVTTKREDVPAALLEKMCVLRVECTEEQIKNNAGTWAGGSRPKEQKSKEQIKLDEELLELAFDGELEEVKKLLEKGADQMAKDGRGNTALSEAAVKGHVDTVRVLLDWKAPTGSDPNCVGGDGRTPLHRAAFGGYIETVELLLSRGSDPRLKDRNGETAFDLGSTPECQELIKGFDIARTETLREERMAAIDKEDESLVRNEEDRIALEKRRKMKTLQEYAEKGEKDLLEMELMDIERSQIGTFRDDRGNSVLHIAAIHGRVECVVMLLDDMGLNINLRDSKGWTPIAVAGFHGHKAVCKALMARKADPSIINAYRKDAIDVAKDDEIKEVLRNPSAFIQASSLTPCDLPGAVPEEETSEPKAKAKGKAKAMAKSGTVSDAEPKAEAKAKGKAKAKAKGKR